MKKILVTYIPLFVTCTFLFLMNLSLKAAPSPANERLVWTFDEDDSNDIKVEDESGNGLKGTLNGTFPNPARVTVDCGKALQFSHANGTYVTLGSAQPTLAYATTVTGRDNQWNENCAKDFNSSYAYYNAFHNCQSCREGR